MERGLAEKGSGVKASANMFSGGSMVEALRKSAMLLKATLGALGLWGGLWEGVFDAAKSLASIMSYEFSVEVSILIGESVRDMMVAHNR
jgi:hypothetical protein